MRVLNIAFSKGTTKRSQYVFSGATSSDVIVHDLSREDVNESANEEVSILSGNVAIFDIKLPKLIGAIDLPVTRNATKALFLTSFLWQSKAMSLANPMHLLVIDHNPVVASEIESKFSVATFIIEKIEFAI